MTRMTRMMLKLAAQSFLNNNRIIPGILAEMHESSRKSPGKNTGGTLSACRGSPQCRGGGWSQRIFENLRDQLDPLDLDCSC